MWFPFKPTKKDTWTLKIHVLIPVFVMAFGGLQIQALIVTQVRLIAPSVQL